MSSNLSYEEMMEKYMTVHIFKLSIFRLQFMKKINILGNIREYMLKHKEQEISKINWLFDLDFETLTLNLDIKMVVNDRMHFCIRLNLKNERDNSPDGERKERHQIEIDGDGHEQEHYQIYYFENCTLNLETDLTRSMRTKSVDEDTGKL